MAEMGQKTGTVHKFTYHARGSPGLRDFPPNALPKQLKRLGSAPSGGPTPVVEEAAPKCLRGQAGATTPGGILHREDAPARRDRAARDGGQHCGRVQPQDLQPGGKSSLRCLDTTLASSPSP